MKVTTARAEEEVELIVHPTLSSSINVDSFTDRQQWKLERRLKVWPTVRKDIYSNNAQQQPVLCITCQVRRLAPFFIWNIILIMVLTRAYHINCGGGGGVGGASVGRLGGVSVGIGGVGVGFVGVGGVAGVAGGGDGCGICYGGYYYSY